MTIPTVFFHDPIGPAPAGRIRETVDRSCGLLLWHGCTADLNTWDEEAQEAIIHPADEYAQHAPVLAGVMEPAERFECAACGAESSGLVFVFERDRIEH